MIADVAIVGGGAACAHVLHALARERLARPLRVVVIERGADVGAGLAYGDAADPRHTFGRVATRRRDRGKALRAQAARAIDALAARGSSVEVRRGTVARGFRRDAGGFAIDVEPGDAITAEHVVLATGHWHVDRLAHVERAVDWRWDVRRLHAGVRDGDDVVVLGTSQSAIDIAIALSSRGTRVALASRRGLVPSVWGPLRATRPAADTGANLARLRARDAVVRLADIADAVRADLSALGATPCDDPLGEPWRPRGDGLATLRADLAAAVDARRAAREIPWQAVLWPTVPAVFDLYPRLVAEDRVALEPSWYLLLRYLEAIHVANARRVVELADAGRLTVVALGRDVAIAEDAAGVVVSGELAAARGHRIVDARGPDPRVARSDDPFLHAVLASGVAVAGRAAYLAPHDPPFVDTGGLWVDPATFRVRDDAGRTANLYALGPLALGQFPVYLGLWALRRAGASIAAAIARGQPANVTRR
nr:FAD/NAD(P)-binding protein [Kofleriaceae bacterium]